MTYLSKDNHISQTLCLVKVKLCMPIIGMTRNIGLKLGDAIVTAKPEVVVESANYSSFLTHLHWGSCSANCVYTKETLLCSHPLRSKESATTWSI